MEKTDRQRGVGERIRKRVKCMLVGETGTEVDVGMGPVKQVNKGGSFQDKFKQSVKVNKGESFKDKFKQIDKTTQMSCHKTTQMSVQNCVGHRFGLTSTCYY